MEADQVSDAKYVSLISGLSQRYLVHCGTGEIIHAADDVDLGFDSEDDGLFAALRWRLRGSLVIRRWPLKMTPH